jgi:sRNA-binding protein
VLAHLAQRWPSVFKIDPGERKPLAIGIGAELARLMPEVDPKLLLKALGKYCGNVDYLSALVAGGPRIGLDGSTAGMVSQDEMADAQRRLIAKQEKRERRQEEKARVEAALKLKHENALLAPSEPAPPVGPQPPFTRRPPRSKPNHRINKPELKAADQPPPRTLVGDKPRLSLRDLREAGRRRSEQG